jgi:hypothetical protein
MHKLSILLISLLLSFAAAAQPYGNADRARENAQKTDADLPNPIIRLGYIENDNATLQQFMDNLEVGLRAAGFPNSKIISYSITILPKGQDTRSSETIKGTTLPRAVFNQLQMEALKKGDVVMFENIRLEDTRRAYRMMNDVVIKIL